LDSSTESINYQCENLLSEYYHRLDPILPRDIPLDDPTALTLLKDIANKVDLMPTIKWIQTHWKCDLQSPSEEVPAKSSYCVIQ
jgi:hypothetical protein